MSSQLSVDAGTAIFPSGTPQTNGGWCSVPKTYIHRHSMHFLEGKYLKLGKVHTKNAPSRAGRLIIRTINNK